MNAASKNRSPIQRQLVAYEETCESWKKDHDDLKRKYWACEENVVVGLMICDALEDLERAGREGVFRGEVSCAAEVNDRLASAYQFWLEQTKFALEWVAAAEIEYGTVERATELRSAFERVRARLANWQPPRVSTTLAQMSAELNKAEADELNHILASGNKRPAARTQPKMQEISRDEFVDRLGS